MPTDRPRPALQSYSGATLDTSIPVDLIPALDSLIHKENATRFMALLTAFQILLSTYTHQDDIVVGSPIANRNRAEIEGLIGFFVNMLVLRTDTSGNPSFRSLLGQVRETTLGAFAYQDIPFEKLVEEKQPTRDMSYAPLFQVSFILQNTPNEQVSLPGLTLAALEAESTTTKYDLTLAITETAVGLNATWEYSTALFDESTIARLAAHYTQLLQQIVAQPDLPINELEILTPIEKKLMKSWNETKRPLPSVPHLHQLISQQAAQTPGRVAVKDPNLSLSYQELDTKSNQLAHYLQGLGVQPDSFVAVALERSAEMLIGLLGIWKAGGAYLPLDPSYPAQRLQFMLGDAEAPILLTQSSLVDSLPDHNAHILCLDTDWDTIAQQPETMPESRVTGDHLAYIIYTSGSTGRPKGVQIRHQALANLLTGMKDDPGITPDDKLLAITTLSFDIATVELYLPLLVGAQVVVAPQTAVTDPQRLINLLQSEAITLMQATPATWQMLVGADWQGQPGLRMITGGEVLTVTLAKQLLARGHKLWNMYAPSETTTYSTIQPVLAADIADADAIPIGRPLANTQLYILDEQLNQVPIGVTGELYIGGEGVAPGYLNQPALTAKRFVENPFPGEPSARLYRTGDVVSFPCRWRCQFLWSRRPSGQDSRLPH
ncbi:MAG: amino acid adenylation domain-containing protein [Chloroflexi bacterium]|nr:amino acid adenylation domain-containing protein [Chloroflexota bacterium]